MRPRRRIWTWVLLGTPMLVWLGFEAYGVSGALLVPPAVAALAGVEEGIQRGLGRIRGVADGLGP